MGVTKRDELAVRLDELERIAELREWFDDLWTEGSPATLSDIDDRIRTSSPVPSSASGGSGTSISSSARRISASIAGDNVGKSNDAIADTDAGDARERLVERLRRAPNRTWATEHFELMRKVIQITRLTEEDTQLVTSAPASGTGNRTIVGNRVVFGFVGRPGNWTRYIISTDYPELDGFLDTIPYCFHFKGQDGAPHLPAVTEGLDRAHQPTFKNAWIDAMVAEVDRFDCSPYRSQSPEPIVYRTVVDHDYRERVLDEAFGA